MELNLNRFWFTEESTIGTVMVNGHFECFSLEDEDRKLEDGGEKIPKETAIPRGRYKIVVDKSGKFNRLLPRLLDVPLFSDIRIHSGNKAIDTEGCVTVGQSAEANYVGYSKLALDALMIKIMCAWEAKEEIWITVT
jgi:hypothetical protein